MSISAILLATQMLVPTRALLGNPCITSTAFLLQQPLLLGRLLVLYSGSGDMAAGFSSSSSSGTRTPLPKVAPFWGSSPRGLGSGRRGWRRLPASRVGSWSATTTWCAPSPSAPWVSSRTQTPAGSPSSRRIACIKEEKFEVSLFTPPLGITRSCHHTLTHRPSGRKLAVPDPADPDSENRHDPKAFLRDP
nr:uncharacterized protein LOC117852609 isoform X2 [Setaria viridis]